MAGDQLAKANAAGSVGVVIGFSVSIAASLVFNAFTKPSLALGAFGVATLVFAVYLKRFSELTEWLSLRLSKEQRLAPKDLLIDELTHGLIDYGLLRTVSDRADFTLLAERFEYVRGQNFLNLITDGFDEVTERLRILADHRFEPFAVAVDKALRPGVTIECINAEPDRFYDVSTLDDRIVWAESQSVNYWLVPELDVRCAILIFDDRMAVAYTKPRGRTVCNFTEALWTEDHDLISRLGSFYGDLTSLAEGIQRRRSTDAIDLLKKKRTLLKSARAAEAGSI